MKLPWFDKNKLKGRKVKIVTLASFVLFAGFFFVPWRPIADQLMQRGYSVEDYQQRINQEALIIEPLPENDQSGSILLPWQRENEKEVIPEPIPEPEPVNIHVEIPEEVRAIYWTAHTASNYRAEQLTNYMIETGLNSVVIDLKMDNGALGFEPLDESLKPYMMKNPSIKDLEGLLAGLKEKGIYRIARLAVMRDSTLARTVPSVALRYPGGSFWVDNTGVLWVDPAAPEVADYAIALAREAYARGFDEVQFDYVRFASDGSISSIRYPVYNPATETKDEVMFRFFEKVSMALRADGIPLSFDTFGMPFIRDHGYNIGQKIVDFYQFGDYISPMTYPSHYYPGFRGYSNPALYPYDVVKSTLDSGITILEEVNGLLPEETRPKLRPWIQDFDIGAVYTAARIEAQINAVRDAGGSGWMLWNARNVYEPANYLPSGE
ncbi:putative glycoside hydrolase [Patescibacteria group bacterium]